MEIVEGADHWHTEGSRAVDQVLHLRDTSEFDVHGSRQIKQRLDPAHTLIGIQFSLPPLCGMPRGQQNGDLDRLQGGSDFRSREFDQIEPDFNHVTGRGFSD